MLKSLEKSQKPTTKKKRVEVYIPVEKNIYKVNNRYRVRVGKDSIQAITLKQARAFKRILTGNLNRTDRIW